MSLSTDPNRSRLARSKEMALLAVMVCVAIVAPAGAQDHREKQTAQQPWMDRTLSPDVRAAMVLRQMTLDEKISLLHGTNGSFASGPNPHQRDSNGGAGYVVGVPRLGIPGIQMADAAYGVTRSGVNGRYSTALPSDLAATSSWDPQAARAYGALIGRELRAQGYNMSLGGGVNLAREPQDGRTFEYQGEDPVLAGTMVGATMQGLQAQHVIGDIKHYAVNDQESGRTAVNSLLNKRALRETDLLAFEIGLRISHAGAVMCSYNRVNGDYACENKYLLTDVLKKDWGFSGFVLSDWMATHSTVKASAAGLDNEEPSENFYGEALKQAVQSGRVPMAELDDHVRRILRTEFACGVVDDPPVKSVLDVEGGLRIAQRLAEQSIVLLQNKNGLLPLDAAKVRSIAVIGLHADVGMISGAGSAQVDAPLGNAVAPPGHVTTRWQDQIWFPTSPLKALRRMVPHANVQYNAGTDPDAAAVLAKSADVAIVFAYQWESEGMDLGNLTLPDNQDTLIERVAAANPHTIVVMETGGPMLMPWANQVSGIVEAWYAGSRGAWAVANVLFGKVNPTAKLPITFPLHEDELPPPGIVRPPEQSTEAHAWKKAQKAIAAGMPPAQAKLKVFADGFPAFPADYNQAALLVGYKWYDAKQLPVLFPFGYGLSYTTYAYSNLKVTPGQQETIRFTVRNTGKRAGAEVAEVYAALPASAGEPPKRLVGWSKVALQPGESKEVTVTAPREYLSIFNETKNGWELVPGTYTFLVGGSSQDLPLHQPVDLK